MADSAAPALQDLPAELRKELDADAETLGLIVHGSRASGFARPDSDWDVIRIVTEDAYQRRKQQGTLHEKRSSPPLDTLYQSIAHLQRLAGGEPGWWMATYDSSVVVLDRTGEIGQALEAIRLAGAERAHAAVAMEYDSYLNSYVRSLKSWLRGDELGGRLHAAESALHLVRTLCGAGAPLAAVPRRARRDAP